MERRNVMTGGLAAGLTALVAGDDAAAAQGDGSGEAVAAAVRELRRALEESVNRPWAPIRQIREQQRIWLRANHKYPDFIEIGLDVWDALYDWHVRHQQPIGMTRTTDGRYVMPFMFTTFILRPDQDPDYIGPPFDAANRQPAQ